MTAEQYLRQIRKLDAVIVNKLKDHRRWVELAEGIGGFSVGERVQASRNLHRGADAIGRYIDIESEINELRAQRNGIVAVIEELPPDEYQVIYKIYVEGYMLKELPSKFKRSYEWCKTRKKNGEAMIQEIIDGDRANSSRDGF